MTTNRSLVTRLLSGAVLLLAACSASHGGGTNDEDVGSQHGNVGGAHKMPKLPNGWTNHQAPANAHLTNHGGPVIPNVKVYTIYWGGQVDNQSQIEQFYTDITQSAYFDWLTEYNTNTQQIGHGSFGGSYADTNAPMAASLDDSQIQQELQKLIQAGNVPPPDDNNYYAFYFPAGISITQQGQQSCVAFCAYHGTASINGKNAFYGVMPDLSGACGNGCGGGSKLDNTTEVSSHELIEAVTDAGVGVNSIAWYDDTNNGEIGDLCVGQAGTVGNWTIQLEFSNAAGSCIATSQGGSSSSSSSGGSSGAGGGGWGGGGWGGQGPGPNGSGGGNPGPPPNGGSCDLCTPGQGPLDPNCDPCAGAVCGYDAYCCQSSWDAQCVAESGWICGSQCP